MDKFKEKVLLSLEKTMKEDGFSEEKIESIKNRVINRVNF